MAISAVEDLFARPTSGPVDASVLDVVSPVADPLVNIAPGGSITYGAGYTPGYSSIVFDGAWLPVMMGGQDRIVLRFYARWSGTPSAKTVFLQASPNGQNAPPADVGAGYTLALDTDGTFSLDYGGVPGGPSGSFEAAWPAGTWWRFEYEFINSSVPDTSAALSTVEVWHDPTKFLPLDLGWGLGRGLLDPGEVNDATRLLVGNLSGDTGVNFEVAHLAVGDEFRVGPFSAAHDPSALVVSPQDGYASLRWADTRFPGATHWDIFRRPATGPEDDGAFDPLTSTRIARIEAGSFAEGGRNDYQDTDLPIGAYVWQVFPVIAGA